MLVIVTVSTLLATGLSAVSALHTDHLGCYSSVPTGWSLYSHSKTLEKNTHNKCKNLCFQKGYLYYGVRYGSDCLCGDLYPDIGLLKDISFCAVRCVSGEEQCLNNGPLDVFATGITDLPDLGKKMSCFADEERKLLGSFKKDLEVTNSPRRCMNMCRTLKYQYAGTENGKNCFCGKDLSSTRSKPLAEQECNVPCPGDEFQTCGANGKVMLYLTGLSDPQPMMTSLGCFTFSEQSPLRSYGQELGESVTAEDCSTLCYYKAFQYSSVTNRTRCWCGDKRPSSHSVLENRVCVGTQEGTYFNRKEKVPYSTVYESTFTWLKALDATHSGLNWCVGYCMALGFQAAYITFDQDRKECFCSYFKVKIQTNMVNNQCSSRCYGNITQTSGTGWVVYLNDTNPVDSVTVSLPENPIISSKNKECEKSETLVNGRPVCRGTVIFHDSFSTSSIEKHWEHEVRRAEAPDFEFAIFTSNQVNSFQKDGRLVIKPTLLTDYQVQQASLSLNGCTGLAGTRECELNAFSYNILPPIHSARLHTRNSFNFRYGIVEIRARLPSGDWLVPELQLLPKDQNYGKNYLSGKIRVAMSRGNQYLIHNGRDIGSSTLESGVLVGTEERVESRSIENKISGSWHSAAHNYTLIWTPNNLLFYVDNQPYQALIPPNVKLTDLMDFTEADNPSWTSGSRIAPFDTDFYLSLGLSVGGMRDFPDLSISNGRPKPWVNFKLKSQIGSRQRVSPRVRSTSAQPPVSASYPVFATSASRPTSGLRPSSVQRPFSFGDVDIWDGSPLMPVCK